MVAPNVDDLRKVHNAFKRAIEIEDKAKTILVGDKLVLSTEEVNKIIDQIKWRDLTYSFNSYRGVRDDIAKLDDDIINLLQDYVAEISRFAEKVLQENTSLRTAMSNRGRTQRSARDPEIDLDDEGSPRVIDDGLPEPALARANTSPPIPAGVALQPSKGERARQVLDGSVLSPSEIEASMVSRPPPVIKITDYDIKTRAEMVRTAYHGLEGRKTSPRIVRYFKNKWNISISPQFVILKCHELGILLDGQNPAKHTKAKASD